MQLFENTELIKTQSLPARGRREALQTHNGSDVINYSANWHPNRCRFYYAAPYGYPSRILPDVDHSCQKRHKAHPGCDVISRSQDRARHTDPSWLFQPYQLLEPVSATRKLRRSRKPAVLLSKVIPACTCRYTSPVLQSSCGVVKSIQLVEEQFA